MSIEHMTRQQDEMVDNIYPDHEEILEDYRRRQMIEHLTGPMVSLFVHAVVVVACAVLMVGREVNTTIGVEYTTQKLPVKKLDDKQKERLDDLQDELKDDIPVAQKHAPTPEKMDMDTTDITVNPVIDTVDIPSNIKPRTSPVSIPMAFPDRGEKARDEKMREYGPGPASQGEQAILNALRWLKNHQNADGSWSAAKAKPQAMTGLALLAFLSHGETPSSEEFGITVQKGLQWAANCMISKRSLEHKGYSHAILTYALCEAYTMTQIPSLKPAMEKGLERIIAGQQPGGGFDYNYKKGDRWDLSVSAWQFQTLMAANAAGATTPGLEEAMKKGVTFLENQAYAVTTFQGNKEGRFGYCDPGKGSGGMQGAGTLCLELLGAWQSSQARSLVNGYLSRMKPDWDQGGQHASYEWYYCTQAIFHGGKKDFQRWWSTFVPMLVKHQQADGHWVEPTTKPGGDQGYTPYLATALNALTLQVPYRYRPMYKVNAVKQAAKNTNPFDLNNESF